MSKDDGLSHCNERKRKAEDDSEQNGNGEIIESSLNAPCSIANQSNDGCVAQGNKQRCWIERMSNTYKRVYWFDPESGDSVWERPQELDPESTESVLERPQASASSSSSSPSTSSSAASVIEPLLLKHREALLPIVSDPLVMSHIGRGVPWTEKDLDKQLRWSEMEWGQDHDKDGRAFYWAIVLDGSCLGFIGFYKYKPTDPYVLRVLLGRAAQGKGLGSRALKEALHQVHTLRPSLASVDGAAHDNNPGGAAVMLKAGFVEMGKGLIGKIPVKNFRFFFD
jgi:RimJ/RimL family protein N-acetyltransferase